MDSYPSRTAIATSRSMMAANYPISCVQGAGRIRFD
jgi:hypothetical protein